MHEQSETLFVVLLTFNESAKKTVMNLLAMVYILITAEHLLKSWHGGICAGVHSSSLITGARMNT